MVAPSPLTVIKGRYRLVLTPTNLAAAYPFGGTELGLAHSCEFEYGARHYVETAEERGGAPHRVFYGGERPVLRAALRGFDKDALGNTFPNYVVGSSGAATLSPDVNGSVRAGKEVTGSLILAVPAESNPTLPAVLVYNGLPSPDDAAKFAMSARVEADSVVAWYAAPDSRGYPYRVGLLEDLAL